MLLVAAASLAGCRKRAAAGDFGQLLGAMQGATSPGPVVPLDTAEQGRARTLANWLWERRCGRS